MRSELVWIGRVELVVVGWAEIELVSHPLAALSAMQGLDELTGA